MDREQEDMQFLGVFGTYKEACKIIFLWRKIFTQISLSLILPLSLICLGHIQVSNILFAKIINNELQLNETQPHTTNYDKLSDRISSEFVYLWLFKAAYLTFLLIFSLLSTSAVVYTIASIYTAREVTYKKVMSVVPKVWKRLMVTFFSVFLAVFAYNVVAALLFVVSMCTVLFIGPISKVLVPIYYVWLLLYFVGIFYMGMVWQLASVVSVLEDAYGFKAMRKSRELLKGKMLMAIIIFFNLNLSYFVILKAFEKLVVHGSSIGMVNRVSYGIIFLLLLFVLFLFGLVIHTIIYFVCKSFHHENIDKSALSDHLEVYLGEYIPLKSKDVQLEHYHV